MKRRIQSIQRCRGIRVDTAAGHFEADIQFAIPAEAIVRSDDPALGIDWRYLTRRIRRVAAASPRRTSEALAEQMAKIVFADVGKTNQVEVAIRCIDCATAPGGSPSPATAATTTLAFERRSTLLGPKAPGRDVRRAALALLAGGIVKALARPFHWLLPKWRRTMPALDPARTAPLSDTPIPRIIWQTNFTDKCSFPVWRNYLRNRRLSADFEHRFLDTGARAEYVRRNAPPRVAAAYGRLTDGAAQADLWRLVALYKEGGVYLDIDATLVKPLSEILAGRDAVYLWDRRRFSNFFLATVPGNPVFAEFIERVVDGIEHHRERGGRTVFYVTGPGALEEVLDERPGVEYLPRKSVALTGAYTDEKYQYIDRPRSKWTHHRDFIAPARQP